MINGVSVGAGGVAFALSWEYLSSLPRCAFFVVVFYQDAAFQQTKSVRKRTVQNLHHLGENEYFNKAITLLQKNIMTILLRIL